tara:strand:- start:374 stop:742 length:369 start_codon:yes stop_codon:yes gene_type:complete
MKITKSQLKQIIKEELEEVLKEVNFLTRSSKAMPVRSIKSYGAGGGDPDSDEDDAAELAAGLDLTGFQIIKDRGYYFIVDKQSGERVLGPFRTESQAGERAMRPDTRSEFEASKDVLSKLGR